MIPAQHLELFRDRCDRAQEIVLVTHMNPDGDAIGSQTSLARFLAWRGKRVRIINSDPTPESLHFIEDPQHPIQVYDARRHDALLSGVDLLILVDNSAPDRLGSMEAVITRAAERTMCIDHHPGRDAPWAINIVDVGFCATSGMIYELVTAAGWTPDRLAAEAIYVGLATDTGFFRFNSTSARAHEIAAKLLALGVAPARVHQEIYERNSAAFTRLLGHALTGLRLDAGGAVASVKITHQLIETLQAEDDDISEITTALLAIDGVRVAVLFRELPDGRIKVSLRSKGELDVHGLAVEFGGGGHRNASGIVMSCGLTEAVRVITERATGLIESSGAERPA